MTMENKVDILTDTFECAGGWYTSLHHLNPNVPSEARQLKELMDKAEHQNMLRRYGYRDASFF